MFDINFIQKIFFLVIGVSFMISISVLGYVHLETIGELWWLFFAALVISLIANVAGISSAAIVIPLLLLVFPLVIEDVSGIEALRIGIINESFGLASSALAFFAFGLVDKKIAASGILLAVPYAVSGALFASYIPEAVLFTVIATLLIASVTLLWFGNRILFERRMQIKGGETNLLLYGDDSTHLRSSDGKEYVYCRESKDSWKRKAGFSAGGFFQGAAGFGLGELGVISMIMSRIPVRVAIGTMHVIIAVAAIVAAVFHVGLSFFENSAISWDILFLTVPAAILGGQLAPFVSARVSARSLEMFVSVVFIVAAILLVLLALK